MLLLLLLSLVCIIGIIIIFIIIITIHNGVINISFFFNYKNVVILNTFAK